jgi:arylsulfatase A-like enzyme
MVKCRRLGSLAFSLLALLVLLVHAQKDKSSKESEICESSSSSSSSVTENGEIPVQRLSTTSSSRSGGSGNKNGPMKPHIILTLFDDLGYHDLGNFDGFPRHQCKAPVMDHLMSTGIRFQNFYSTPICSPTRAAIMTGRYPLRYGGNCGTPPGLAADQGWAPLGEPMLAERMKAAGYSTKMSGKWHLGLSTPKITPTGRGFDEFYGKYRGGGDHWTHTTDLFADSRDGSVWPGHPDYEAAGGNLDLHHDRWAPDGKHYHRHIGDMNGTHSTDVITNGAIRMIQEHVIDGPPLFLYLAYQAPHWPVQNPAGSEMRNMNMGKQRRKWCGLVSHLDDNIGRVFSALESKGMSENLLFLALSDNGGDIRTGASNYPYRGDKMTPWEGGTKTPMFISSYSKNIIPEHLRGSVNNGLGHVTDLFTTLISVGGGDASPNKSGPIDGYNLWDSWMSSSSSSSPRKEMVYNIDQDGLAYIGSGFLTGGNSMGRKMSKEQALQMVRMVNKGNTPEAYGALRVGKYKLIVGYPGRSDWYGTDPTQAFTADYIMGPDATDYDYLQSGGPFKDAKVGDGGGSLINDNIDNLTDASQYMKKLWLFDLEKDPAEHNDLSSLMPDKVKELKVRLQFWNKQTAPSLAATPMKSWTKEKRIQVRTRARRGMKKYKGYKHIVQDWWDIPIGWESPPPMENVVKNSKL